MTERRTERIPPATQPGWPPETVEHGGEVSISR
jgi:hypothetical protein